MPNSIAYIQNYTTIIDEVYQRARVSRVLNSGRRMVRAGRNAREIMIPKITVFGLGDYVRNEGYKTGSINYEFETKTFNYDRGSRHPGARMGHGIQDPRPASGQRARTRSSRAAAHSRRSTPTTSAAPDSRARSCSTAAPTSRA